MFKCVHTGDDESGLPLYEVYTDNGKLHGLFSAEEIMNLLATAEENENME